MSNSETVLTLKDPDTGRETKGTLFLHSPLAVVTDMVPRRASWLGSETVVLLGTGFDNGMNITVKFGDRYSPYVTRHSASKISCVAPSQESAHNVTVLVSTNGVDYGRNSLLFEYVSTTLNLNAFPSSGPVLGGSRIQVTAHVNPSLNEISCVFGETRTPASRHGSGVLFCDSPAHVEGKSELRLSAGDAFLHGGLTVPFYFFGRPFLQNLSPSTGFRNGGQTVSVVGVNFHDHSLSVICRFGSISVGATVINASTLTCESPQVETPGDVQVQISFNGIDFELRELPFRYVEMPTIKEIQPLVLYMNSEVVTIHGRNFVDDIGLSCQIGSESRQPVAITSQESVICGIPEIAPGRYSFILLALDKVVAQHAVEALPGYATAILPTSGGVHGGSIITVLGSAFSESRRLSCVFDQIHDDAIFVNASAVLCRVPRGDVGMVDFDLRDDTEKLSSVSFLFEYLEEDRGYLISVVPSVGPVHGQTLVTISGTSLFPSDVECVVDKQRVSGGVLTDSQITCSMPAHEAGTARVFVEGTNLRGDFVNFLYRQPLFIYQLEPVVLALMQPAMITISGSGFVNISTLTCRIGSSSVCKAIFVSSETLVCPTAGLRAGNHSLEISENAQQLAMLDHSIEVVRREVDGIIPSHGPVKGGTMVAISDVIFARVKPEVFFGTSKVTCDLIRQGDVQCLSPPHLQGSVTISVINQGSAEKVWTFIYEVVDADSVLGKGWLINPTSGIVEGGTAVTISGANFDSQTSLWCRFDSTRLTATIVSSSQAVCETTPGKLGFVTVELGSEELGFTETGTVFQYVVPVVIYSVAPSHAFGSQTVAQTLALQAVTVTGQHFAPHPGALCRFGNTKSSRSSWLSSSLIVCDVPSHAPGSVTVSVANDGQTFAGSCDFEYVLPIHFRSIYPSRGPIRGATSVTIEASNLKAGSSFSCKFNTSTVRAVRQNQNQITCNTPAYHATGLVGLYIIKDSENVDHHGTKLNVFDTTFSFEYGAIARVEKVVPSSGPMRGGSAVMVYGENLPTEGSASCRGGSGVSGVGSDINDDALSDAGAGWSGAGGGGGERKRGGLQQRRGEVLCAGGALDFRAASIHGTAHRRYRDHCGRVGL